MLAKILEDMWVEPEVLEALSEEQKRILFLKMREEQVRRWTAQDEKEEKEGRDNKRPKKGKSATMNLLYIGITPHYSLSFISSEAKQENTDSSFRK